MDMLEKKDVEGLKLIDHVLAILYRIQQLPAHEQASALRQALSAKVKPE